MNKLLVSTSPHIRDKSSITRIMLDVVIALIPAGAIGVWKFGLPALWIILASVASAVAAEALIQWALKKPITVYDGSAVVTGLLLAYNLSPTVPLWIPIIGSFIAIIVIKQLFGGLGRNFMNPALGARAILVASWPVIMTTWISPDGMASATPLAIIKGSDAASVSVKALMPGYMDLFIGNIGGSIGEVSALALLLGGGYLIARKIISWHVPVMFIGSVFLLTWIFGGSGLFTGDGLYHILSGGLMLGAVFMATDYSSSPVTTKGKIIMGLGCGVITIVIRLFGGYPEGVAFSILLMNLVVPIIDNKTQPKIYGEVRESA